MEKWNTANRINDEYWYAVKDIVESERFPYYQNIAFGNIEFTDSDTPVGSDIPEYAIATSSLELDAEYDIYEMGKKAGHLTIYIYDNEVTIERLSEILLGIRQLFDKENISFYIIDCVLEYPRPEDDGPWKEGRVEVMNFLYEDIYEDGLKERVNESNEKAKAYYEATGIATIGIDDNLYIEELPEDKQPGTNVRRVNGKELSDDEMIEHYINLVKNSNKKIKKM